jgi:hypothetical protein
VQWQIATLSASTTAWYLMLPQWQPPSTFTLPAYA